MHHDNPHWSNVWQTAYTQFVSDGDLAAECNSGIHYILSLDSPQSLSEQFQILSHISNFHWGQYLTLSGKLSAPTTHVNLSEHLIYQPLPEGKSVPSYHPKSPRNRILFLSLNNMKTHLTALLRHILIPTTGTTTTATSSTIPNEENVPDDCPIPIRRRRITSRVVSVTADMLRQSLGIDGSGSTPTNMMAALTLYQQFANNLLIEGTIIWRLHHTDHDVFIMNDYDMQSGQYQPLAFVHVTRIQGHDGPLLHCTCKTYGLLQSIGLTEQQESDDVIISSKGSLQCMHCRFFLEEVEKLLPITFTSPSTLLEKKLTDGKHSLNIGVVPVAPTKLSVRSDGESVWDTGCSFVHISPCSTYVACQSGKCKAKLNNRKKIPKLLSLNEASVVCVHLQTLRANQETWAQLRGNDDNQQDTSTTNREVGKFNI